MYSHQLLQDDDRVRNTMNAPLQTKLADRTYDSATGSFLLALTPTTTYVFADARSARIDCNYGVYLGRHSRMQTITISHNRHLPSLLRVRGKKGATQRDDTRDCYVNTLCKHGLSFSFLRLREFIFPVCILDDERASVSLHIA
jgi:hypothetical protein